MGITYNASTLNKIRMHVFVQNTVLYNNTGVIYGMYIA